jgi:hypothetical protein
VLFTDNLARGGDRSRGGRTDKGSGGGHGGAVADDGDDMIVLNCVFVANQATGAVRVTRSEVRETGFGKGGGLYHGSGVMRIRSTLFERNVAFGGHGNERSGGDVLFGEGKGGAIYNRGTLEVEGSTFLLNRAVGGDSSFCCDNFSPFWGYSGAGLGGGILSEGILKVLNCTLAGNIAQGGGPAEGDKSYPGDAYGGALFIGDGAASLLNTTIADNSTQVTEYAKAFGASIARAIGSGTVSLVNTILSCSPSQTNVSGVLLDGGHNVCSDASAAFTLASSYDNTDAKLAPLTNNGGPAPTMALLPNSPAIDAGDVSSCLPTDQRGVRRPQGLACDIGAFELAPKLTTALVAGAGFALGYSFRAGVTNDISASSDLMDWKLLDTRVTDENGTFEFRDPAALKSPRRFYRVQLQRTRQRQLRAASRVQASR